MNKDEIQKIISDIVIPKYVPGNFVSAYENIKGSVYGNKSIVEGYVDQRDMEVGKNVNQRGMIVKEHVIQIDMKVNGNVIQKEMNIIKGFIDQRNMNVGKDVDQEGIIVKTHVYQNKINISGNFYQEEACIGGDVDQGELNVEGIVSQTGMDVRGSVYQANAKIGKLVADEDTIFSKYVLYNAKIGEFEGEITVGDYLIEGADIPKNMIKALEEGKRRYQEKVKARKIA